MGAKTKNLDQHLITLSISKQNDGIHKTVVLSTSGRYNIFIYIILVNIFSNFDQGYFPAATAEFKHDYQIHDTFLLGIYGSAVFLGNLLGIININ
jgi:hypothetical protein